jgi:gliding motility-associated-like protein
VNGEVFDPALAGIGDWEITYSYTDANGCSNYCTFIITVTLLPDVTCPPDFGVCIDNGPFTLSGGLPEGGIYTGTAVSDGVFDPEAAGIGTWEITYTYTDPSGCTNSCSFFITVNDLPIVFAGEDQNISNGTSTSISDATASGALPLTFEWSPADLLIDPYVLNPVTVILNTTTTFTLLVTDGNGCDNADQVTIFITGDPLTLNISATPEDICLGESTQLFAEASGGSGVYSYFWTSDPEGFTSVEQNPVVSPAVTTTYVVEVNDGYSSLKDTIIVTVQPIPETYAGNDRTTFNGACVVIDDATASGALPMTYIWSPEDMLVDPYVLNPTTTSLSENTTFTLLVIDGHGCENTDQVTITITGEPLYVGISIPPVEICEGDTVQLFAEASGGSGEYTYNWTSYPEGFNSQDQNPLIYPSATTTFIVEANDGHCKATDSAMVIVHPLPVLHCPGTIEICEDALPFALTESTPAGGTYSGKGISNGVFYPMVAGAGMHEITYVYQDEFGCSNSCTFDIIVHPLLEGCNIFGPDTACPNTTDNIYSGPDGMLAYEWSIIDGTATIVGPSNEKSVNVTAGEGRSFILSLSISDGVCTSTCENRVMIPPPPRIGLIPDMILCEGETFIVYGVAESGKPIIESYWITPDGNSFLGSSFMIPSVTPNHSGTYTFVVIDNCGCAAEEEMHLTVIPTPEPSISDEDTLLLDLGGNINAGSGYAYYLWSTGEYTQTITPEEEGWYFVTVSTIHGCIGTDSVYVMFPFEIIPEVHLFIPNAFTPNNDGLNDTFKVVAYGIEYIIDFKMQIFNRWGEKLFETSDISHGWDGIKEGELCPGDGYVYKVTYKVQGVPGKNGEKMRTGVVVLLL